MAQSDTAKSRALTRQSATAPRSWKPAPPGPEATAHTADEQRGALHGGRATGSRLSAHGGVNPRGRRQAASTETSAAAAFDENAIDALLGPATRRRGHARRGADPGGSRRVREVVSFARTSAPGRNNERVPVAAIASLLITAPTARIGSRDRVFVRPRASHAAGHGSSTCRHGGWCSQNHSQSLPQRRERALGRVGDPSVNSVRRLVDDGNSDFD